MRGAVGEQLELPTPKARRKGKHGVGKQEPVHVTLKLLPEAAGLRNHKKYTAIRRAMRTCQKDRFAICEYSIQGDHVHLVCEPRDTKALARGIQGFASLVARRLNAIAKRRGKVFADRYHSRVLRTPREVRNVLCYVINNWLHHWRENTMWVVDPYSSAPRVAAAHRLAEAWAVAAQRGAGRGPAAGRGAAGSPADRVSEVRTVIDPTTGG